MTPLMQIQARERRVGKFCNRKYEHKERGAALGDLLCAPSAGLWSIFQYSSGRIHI